MVENTPGCADDELRTAFEFGELVFERLAAGDGDHVDADRVGERPRDGSDLPRKFARRGDDQRLFLGFVRSNTLQNGQQKGERFARAGTALGEYVATFEYGRDKSSGTTIQFYNDEFTFIIACGAAVSPARSRSFGENASA